MVQGTLQPISEEIELNYLLIKFPEQIVYGEGPEEIWQFADDFEEKLNSLIKSFKGYPYLIIAEKESGEIEPLQ
eukprot:7343400-Karenia_brevis.AAC.1